MATRARNERRTALEITLQIPDLLVLLVSTRDLICVRHLQPSSPAELLGKPRECRCLPPLYVPCVSSFSQLLAMTLGRSCGALRQADATRKDWHY